jgi:hypothetical protein
LRFTAKHGEKAEAGKQASRVSASVLAICDQTDGEEAETDEQKQFRIGLERGGIYAGPAHGFAGGDGLRSQSASLRGQKQK